jgi:hypothetical protein
LPARSFTEENMFFSEKKNQKTFTGSVPCSHQLAGACGEGRGSKSFLLPFFKK